MKLLIALLIPFTALSTYAAQAATGDCESAKTVITTKTWEAINYKYSQQYISENKAEFEKAVNSGSDVFFKDCRKFELSNDQELLQGVLNFAAMPIKIIADEFLVKVGLPALGDKALYIDVKAISEDGIWGGPNSFFRKPFG